MENAINLYLFESFGGMGDYLPILIIIEDGYIEELLFGDNVHNMGYTQYFEGYKDCLKVYCAETVNAEVIDISNRNELKRWERYLRACNVYDDFLKEIELEENNR